MLKKETKITIKTKIMNMKKILLMMVAVFACMSVKAVSIVKVDDNNYTLIINGSTDAASFNTLDGISDANCALGPVGSRDYSKVTKIEFTGDFTNGWSSGWLTNSDANEPTKIKTIDMSGAIFENGTANPNISWSLREYNNLEEIIWPTAGHIYTLPQHAIWKCGIELLHIPGYITLIKGGAIDEDSNASVTTGRVMAVIFDEYDPDGDGNSNVNMVIETQAFQNTYGLYDVYINTTGNITAANNAFPFWVTYAHTDANRRLATLHFPEEKASTYANPHELSEQDANDDGRFQAWLQAHATSASNAHNGWWEFVSNAPISNYDPEPFPKFLKTFSHPTLSFIMGEGLKAYIVNGITKVGNNYEISLKKVNVIPAGTGVILYGEANAQTADGKPTYALTTVNYTGPGAYIRGGSYSSDWNNLLMPTSPKGTTEANDNGVDVEPYVMSGNTVTFRNFGLGYFSKTVSGAAYYAKNGKYGNHDCSGNDPDKNERQEGDFVGFFRMKKGSHIGARKAYLQLLATEYPVENGGEVTISDTEKSNSTVSGVKNYQLEINRLKTGATGDAKYLTASELQAMNLWQTAVWEKDWGVRDFGTNSANMMVTFDGEPGTDGIKLVITPAVEENSAVYNLQGVEVTNPTKGVYIKNGKKFVVK